MKSEKYPLYFGKLYLSCQLILTIANAVFEVYVKYQIEVV